MTDGLTCVNHHSYGLRYAHVLSDNCLLLSQAGKETGEWRLPSCHVYEPIHMSTFSDSTHTDTDTRTRTRTHVRMHAHMHTHRPTIVAFGQHA